MPQRSAPDLKWEPSRGGALFPHLYAPLDVAHARDIYDLSRSVRRHPGHSPHLKRPSIMLTKLASLARPMLFLMEPERAHDVTLRSLEIGHVRLGRPSPMTRASAVDIWYGRIPNPIGIAAGFDKNGRVPDVMIRVGFGFAEIGTVTPLPQVGNPKPRVLRLIRDRALINRLGFNNAGHLRVKARLALRDKEGWMGVNVGANKDSADRTADYVKGIETFYDDANYFMVNISSPNTPGLRDLQAPGSAR